MSDKQSAKPDQDKPSTVRRGRELFLASLEAYCKLIENGRHQLTEYREQRAELFDELVKRGEQVQLDAGNRVKNMNLSARMNLEERLEKMRCSFSALKDAFGLADKADSKA